MKKIRPPIKTHGGKYYLCDWIIEKFPKNYQDLIYVEPMCAGASVFLNKKISKKEIINDIDKKVICIFNFIKNNLEDFISRLDKIDYNKKNFDKELKKIKFKNSIELAINEYVLRRMSRGGMKKAFAWSSRLRGGIPGDINSWKTMLSLLPCISTRLEKTIISNEDGIDIFKKWDSKDTLTYFDPPYLSTTRKENCRKIYDYEMSENQHILLLDSINEAKGKVLISGYNCELYNDKLKKWKKIIKHTKNNAGQNKIKEKRTEVIWLNY